MPVWTRTQTNFTGADDATGLLDFVNDLGDGSKTSLGTNRSKLQIKLNSFGFVTSGTIGTWTVSLVNRETSVEHLLRESDKASGVYGGPVGFMLVPTYLDPNTKDSLPWQLKVVSNGQDQPGEFFCDYELVNTESP